MNVHTITPRAADAQAANLPQGTPPELIDSINDAVRDVFNRDGPSAFAMSPEAAVAHEVGHAIVATHEGVAVKSVRIFGRTLPDGGTAWGGWCTWNEGWTTGPDTSADDDLSRARIVIAGLAAEAITGKDKPGSSIDELALSQLIGHNAAVKLADPAQTDAEHWAFSERLWHEQVWGGAVAILYKNQEPFHALAEALCQRRKIEGGRLRKILANATRRKDT